MVDLLLSIYYHEFYRVVFGNYTLYTGDQYNFEYQKILLLSGTFDFIHKVLLVVFDSINGLRREQLILMRTRWKSFGSGN